MSSNEEQIHTKTATEADSSMEKELSAEAERALYASGPTPQPTQDSSIARLLHSGAMSSPDLFHNEVMLPTPSVSSGVAPAGGITTTQRRFSEAIPPSAVRRSNSVQIISKSMMLTSLDLDEETLANAAPLHMHTMLIPSRLSLSSVSGQVTPSRSRSSSRGASRSVSPARGGTTVASATGTSVSTVTSGSLLNPPSSPLTTATTGALTASNLDKLGLTTAAGSSAPGSITNEISSAASSVVGDGIPSSSASAPVRMSADSAAAAANWEVSSTNAIDPDIFLDKMGLDDLEPPGEITIGGSFSSLHGSLSGSMSALPSVVERASEETLEDFHAFCDVPSHHSGTVASNSSVSGSSVAGGSVAGDASCFLETLEEEDDDLSDDDDEDHHQGPKRSPPSTNESQQKKQPPKADTNDSTKTGDDEVTASIKGALTSMLASAAITPESSTAVDRPTAQVSSGKSST